MVHCCDSELDSEFAIMSAIDDITEVPDDDVRGRDYYDVIEFQEELKLFKQHSDRMRSRVRIYIERIAGGFTMTQKDQYAIRTEDDRDFRARLQDLKTEFTVGQVIVMLCGIHAHVKGFQYYLMPKEGHDFMTNAMKKEIMAHLGKAINKKIYERSWVQFSHDY